MANLKVVNDTPIVSDFFWRRPLLNPDKSFKRDENGNILVEQMVVRTVDSIKLDKVARFIEEGGSLTSEEIEKLKQDIAKIEEKIGTGGGSGGVNYAIKSYSGASSYNLEPSKYNVFNINLTEATTTISLSANDVSSANLIEIRIYLKQGSGANTVTWSNNIKWLNDVTPALSFEKGKTDIVQLSSVDGGASWLGSMVASWN